MSANSKQKGKRGEREAAKAVAEALGCEAQRGVQYQGGNDSPDIRTSVQGVHFEVKRCEALRLWDALAQAGRESDGKVPVVLHRSNRRDWIAVVPLDRLRELADAVLGAAGEEIP